MPTTSNFGWTTPADTDLVKDGAAAIRTLGNGIDTSLVDLKGGTTGQVLSKNSNTDLDFTWVSDATGIPATIFDAKGDIIAASAADTAARLAVGTNGQVLTADSTQSTGLAWTTISSGGMTLINTGGTTLSGSSVTISSIPNTYKMLKLVIVNLYMSNDNRSLDLRFNSDTGANYQSHWIRCNNGSLDGSATDNNTRIRIITNVGNLTTQYKKSFGDWDIYNYTDTSAVYIRGGELGVYQTFDNHFAMTSGLYDNSSAITSITLYPGADTMSGGTAYLYGVN